MIKKIRNYQDKTKKITQQISNLPIEKIVLGTVVVILPGGALISGVYLAQKKYKIYLKTTDQPQPFLNWISRESSLYVVYTTAQTIKFVDRYTSQTKAYTTKKMDKIASTIKKRF